MEAKKERKRWGRRGEAPDPTDVHVGSRVRLRRSMLGLSQAELGTAVGLSFQQIQKYESGANRIGASRLLEFARLLDVPIAFFYDAVDPVRAAPFSMGPDEGGSDAPEDDLLRRAETIELVARYYGIPEERVRRRLLELARVLARFDSEE